MASSAGHELNIGLVRGAIANTAAVAAGSGDATSVTGAVIDLTSLGARFNAAALCVNTQSTLASGKVAAVTTSVEHSANNSDWTAYTAVANLYTHTASGAAATAIHRGKALNVDLSKVNRYIRAVVAVDLDAANTDTSLLSAHWVFGNGDRVPAV